MQRILVNVTISRLQITPVSVESFRNPAFMFCHSIFYDFQMEINVALATPLKMTRHFRGHREKITERESGNLLIKRFKFGIVAKKMNGT